MPPKVTFVEPAAAAEAVAAAVQRRRKALSRLKARVSALSAIKSATLNYEAWDSRFWGYDTSHLIEDERERQRDQGEEAGGRGQRAQSEALAIKKERTTSPTRRLFKEPDRFLRTNRGITVRSGNPADQEYAKMKAAELKLLCSLTVMGSDMNHYRHHYFEMRRGRTDRGKTKYYQVDDVVPLRVPQLWLKDASTACDSMTCTSQKELDVKVALEDLPELWNVFYQHRKRKTELLHKERTKQVEVLQPAVSSIAAKKTVSPQLPGNAATKAEDAGGAAEGKTTLPKPPANLTKTETEASATAAKATEIEAKKELPSLSPKPAGKIPPKGKLPPPLKK